ncbi:reverse transcriptase family protein [Actinoplanes sp. TFC3]|uniref:reverse transcriptase family protein n=1 Tax=Actinoplanes sp. TFC3 TaxID=1710355 RepID=UPI00128FEDC1|nr:reverse transcriptase family protein [Actinoplanes sp. TFC3]
MTLVLTADILIGAIGYPTRVLEELALMLRGGGLQVFSLQSHRKRRGGVREIVKPRPLLDSVSKNLYRSLLELLPYRPPDHVHGFVRGRSTLTNARAHLGKPCVLRVDLEDFFPSISSTTLQGALDQQGCDEKAAELVVSLATVFQRLPIGLSTSPFLSNVVFLSTDYALSEYARANNLSFTRYVDDLAFSGDVNDQHFEAISEILNNSGWSINVDKTAFMRRGGRQYVTGLYVGMADRPRVPRSLRREMRRTFHLIEKFGYECYMEDFGGEAAAMFPQRLRGWARYIASIEPDLGYPLLRRIDELVPDQYVSARDLEAYYDYGEYQVIESAEDLYGSEGPDY